MKNPNHPDAVTWGGFTPKVRIKSVESGHEQTIFLGDAGLLPYRYGFGDRGGWNPTNYVLEVKDMEKNWKHPDSDVFETTADCQRIYHRTADCLLSVDGFL